MSKSIFFSKYGGYFSDDNGDLHNVRFENQFMDVDGIPCIKCKVTKKTNEQGMPFYSLTEEGEEKVCYFYDNGIYFRKNEKQIHVRLPYEKRSKATEKFKYGKAYIVREVKKVKAKDKEDKEYTYFTCDIFDKDFKPTKQ